MVSVASLRAPKRTALAKVATSVKAVLFKENTVLLPHISTRLIKYQTVLVGKVDLPQKLLPGEYHELSNRMYFPSFFKFTTAEGLLVPKNQGTPPSLTIF